jgi:hypothetical protein
MTLTCRVFVASLGTLTDGRVVAPGANLNRPITVVVPFGT